MTYNNSEGWSRFEAVQITAEQLQKWLWCMSKAWELQFLYTSLFNFTNMISKLNQERVEFLTARAVLWTALENFKKKYMNQTYLITSLNTFKRWVTVGKEIAKNTDVAISVLHDHLCSAWSLCVTADYTVLWPSTAMLDMITDILY